MKKIKKMKKSKYFVLIIIASIFALSIVHVVIANSISTTGASISKIQNELNLYKKENAILHEKILTLSSLTYVNEKASSEGFVPSKAEIYLLTPLPLAVR